MTVSAMLHKDAVKQKYAEWKKNSIPKKTG